MTTKDKIIDKLNSIQDEELLSEVLQMIELEMEVVKDTIKLTKEQKAAIDEGINDIEKGNVFSSQEARKIVDEWLAKGSQLVPTGNPR